MQGIVAIVSRKGGSGKTTLAGHLAASFAAAGTPTTLLDLDTQGSASRWLAGGRAEDGALCQVLEAGEDGEIGELRQSTGFPGLDIICSDTGLAAAEARLQAEPTGALDAAYAIAGARRDGELAFIDTAPNVGLLVSASLLAADFVVIPALLEPAAVQVLADSVIAVNRARKHNKALRLLGVVPGRVDLRFRHSAQLLEDIRDSLREDVTDTTIPSCGELLAAIGESRLASAGSRGGRAIEELRTELQRRSNG